MRDRPGRGQEQGNLQGESDGSCSTRFQDSSLHDCEAGNDFSSISGDFIYRHHVEPRVKLYVPREESFPIPLKYIDVTRATNASLDVMLEKNIDYYWNVDGDRELSDMSTGFTIFTVLNEKQPDGYTWSMGGLTRKQTTSRPDNVWPDIWKHMSDGSICKEKQKWAIEKPKLEMGSSRHGSNRRRRTREGPEPVCASTLADRVAHAGGEGRINVLPWCRLVGVVSHLRKIGLPTRVSGTGMAVLTYPCPRKPCFGGSKGCARVTGKAGENGQNSGAGRQLTLDKTVGSWVW